MQKLCEVRLVPTSNRSPYNRIDNSSARLAHDVSMMLKFDRRDEYYVTANYVLPLGRDENPCIKQARTINAGGFGWRLSSHGGFKGKGELVLGLNWELTSDETPLSQIWRWYLKLEECEAYEIGKE